MNRTFLIVFLFSALSAYAQSPWNEVRSETIPAPVPTSGVQQIALQIFIDNSSEWAGTGELQSHLRKASGIFLQCGLEIGRVEVKYVTYSERVINSLNNPNPYRGPPELALMKGDLSAVRPAMFLFGRQIPSSASAFNRTSINRLNAGGTIDVTPLLHTTILSSHHSTNRPVPGANASYSTFAHELAHLLGDLDHVDEGNNLMSSRDGANSKSGRLNPAQCRRIQEYSLANFSEVMAAQEDSPIPSVR